MKTPKVKPHTGMYILNADKEPVLAKDLYTWAAWFEKNKDDRIVKQENICDGRFFVSTVFLALDYNFDGSGKPVLFETMVFDNNDEKTVKLPSGKSTTFKEEFRAPEFETMVRYTSHDEAVKGHDDIVRKLKKVYEHKDVRKVDARPDTPVEGEGKEA